MLLDLRFAFRLLLRNPAYTIAALLTLAIGIGATTTVFSVVHGALLRPLPFNESERIASFWAIDDRGTQRSALLNTLQNIQSASKSFEVVAAQQSFYASSEGLPSVSVSIVSLDFMKLFGMHPAIGRNFSPDDLKPDATRVAIISYEYWQSRLGGASDVLGKIVIVPQSLPELTVIGVLPKGGVSTSLHELESVWTPFDLARGTGVYGSFPKAFGRLKPGVTFQQAQAELTAMRDRILPAEGGVSMGRPLVQPMLEDFIGQSRTTILIFSGAVFLVLLIVIVNLAALDLARLPKLESELAVRTALGASRWRLMQLMVLKTLILGFACGALGVAAAAAFHSMIVNSMVGVPRKEDIVIDGTVLLAGFALSLITSLLLGIVPAIRAGRTNIRDMMHSVAPAYTNSRRSRILQDVLTATETAIALVLTIAAGLLINNLWRILSEDIGLKPEGLASVQVSLPSTFDAQRRLSFFRNLQTRIRLMSNVDAVALTSVTPMLGGSYTSVSAVDGSDRDKRYSIQLQGVTADYFSILRIPVLAGRSFNDDEISRNAPVAIVSATLAGRLWPGRNPLGLHFQRDQEMVTVIGVVGDVQYGFYRNIEARARKSFNVASLVLERNTAYYPITFQLGRSWSLARSAVVLARTSGRPKDLAAIVSDLEPTATATAGTFSDFVARATEQQRFQTSVLGAFAVVSLLLASIGIYGVVAHSVVSRTREIGIRMALGAKRSEVFIQVCRQAMIPSIIGMLAGFAFSVGIRQVLTSYLSAIQPDDGPTYVIVVVVTFAVTLLACALPARHATQLNPVQALRAE